MERFYPLFASLTAMQAWIPDFVRWWYADMGVTNTYWDQWLTALVDVELPCGGMSILERNSSLRLLILTIDNEILRVMTFSISVGVI